MGRTSLIRGKIDPVKRRRDRAKALARCDFDSAELLVKEDIVLSADVRAIPDAVERIMNVVRESGCAHGEEADVELALFEAISNAVRHGCGGDPSKTVECCVACDRMRGMLIVVRDPGPGFDPESIPSPVVGQNVWSHHGRGIYLINQCMDEVRFERGGTEIHMRKHPRGRGGAVE